MIQSNYSLAYYQTYPETSQRNDRIHTAEELKEQYPEYADSVHYNLGANAGAVKALMPKPGFWKSLWNGIKKLFMASSENSHKFTIDDVKKTIKIYNTVDKIQNHPNVNYQNPQDILIRYSA